MVMTSSRRPMEPDTMDDDVVVGESIKAVC